MNNTKIFIPLISIFFLIQFSSCIKEDESKLNKEDLLTGETSKQWRIQNAGIDQLTEGPSCVKDDIYTFFPDGQFQRSTGQAKCAAEPPTIFGKWAFNANKTILILSEYSSDQTSKSDVSYTILEITSDILRVKAENAFGTYGWVFKPI